MGQKPCVITDKIMWLNMCNTVEINVFENQENICCY